MHAHLIRIGNSKGIRIPAAILKACRIENDVDIEVADGKLIITPISAPREGWNEAFIAMRAAEDDTLYLDEITEEDTEDWTW